MNIRKLSKINDMLSKGNNEREKYTTALEGRMLSMDGKVLRDIIEDVCDTCDIDYNSVADKMQAIWFDTLDVLFYEINSGNNDYALEEWKQNPSSFYDTFAEEYMYLLASEMPEVKEVSGGNGYSHLEESVADILKEADPDVASVFN